MNVKTFDQKLRSVTARFLAPYGFMFIGLTLTLMVVFRSLGIILTPWPIVLAPLWFPPALLITWRVLWLLFILVLLVLVGFGS